MNWKKLAENWRMFTELNKLSAEKEDINYFYGKKNVHRAKEFFEGFEIFYETILNKSSEYGASFNIGNSLTILSPIELKENIELTVKRNSFWNRLTKNKEQLNIASNSSEIKELLPVADIKNLSRSFSDLKISIKNFDKHQHPIISFGQNVIILESKNHPTDVEQLQLARSILVEILIKLREKKLISSV